jgi:signal transduction histidine kinase
MLPYSFAHASPPDNARLTFAAADFDGDGIDEGVCFCKKENGDHYIAVFRLFEAQHDCVQQINLSFKSFLMGLTDLTGDGLPELVWWQQAAGADVTFVFEELVAGKEGTLRRTIGTVVWDATGSTSRSGRWGGSASVIGAFDLDGNGTKESTAVAVVTGILQRPRGIWLVNWETGDIIWQLPTAAAPTGTAIAADVNGDGIEEIIIGTESPGNGAHAGDWNDSLAYIVVVDLGGEVVWWRELAGFSTRVDLVIDDLDCDGVMEILTVVGGTGDQLRDDYLLRAWRASDGEPLASMPLGGPANSVEILETDAGKRALVALADGTVRRYAFAEGRFVQDAVFESEEGIAVARRVDFGLPSGRSGVMAKTVLGTFVALDLDLRPLAVLSTGESITANHDRVAQAVFPLRGEPTRGVIAQTSDTLYFLHLEKNPLPPWAKRLLAWLRPIGGLAAVLGIVVLVPSWRRRTIAALRRRLIPRKIRGAAVDDLLVELKTGGHGKLTATSTFRRVREQLTMLSYYDADPPEAFRERFAEAVGNAREIGVSTVESIAGEAARLGLAPEPVARVAASLRAARSVITGLSIEIPATGDALALQRRLDDSLPVVDEGLAAVKHAAELERSSQLGTELGRVLSSRRTELACPGLTFAGPDAASLGEVNVVGTSRELTFVFDNLIGNALKAVAERETAAIRVTVTVADQRAIVTVQNSGTGVPPEMQDEVFREGVSDRDGGGHGLARSRELLEQRGGSIRLLQSAPGEGAVFEVRLRVIE